MSVSLITIVRHVPMLKGMHRDISLYIASIYFTSSRQSTADIALFVLDKDEQCTLELEFYFGEVSEWRSLLTGLI